jgi:hypothetical protein
MIVISLLFDHAPAALANHRRYARALGYRHIEIDMSHLQGSEDVYRWLYKYELLLEQLSRAEPDALVLLLSENAAVLRPAPLAVLMEGRDCLLGRTDDEHPQTDVQVWRNTEAIRHKLFKLVSLCRLSVELPEHEGQLLCEFDVLPVQHRVGDLICVIPVAVNLESVWASWNVFALSVRDEKRHRLFRDALLEHINDRAARGLPLLSLFTPEPADATSHSVINPDRPLAIVTLYTPNIARYGRIAEHNFRRYCERHGYTLYIHRAIPDHLNDGKTSGNWLKPALLREYLPHHEWLFWIDADVLFNDMNRKLESIIEGRDAVFARDIGIWPFNSGIMGFRRTQQNYDAFHYILDACSKLDDKSNVYANLGDQHYFGEQFLTHPDHDVTRISSPIEWNTPWIYRRSDSFMVHYIGMWADHKALMMDHDVAQKAFD